MPSSRTPPCGRTGDVNNDGFVDSADHQLIGQHIVGTIVLTGDDFTAADVNGDGRVDVADQLLIFQYITHTIDTFPVCQNGGQGFFDRIIQWARANPVLAAGVVVGGYLIVKKR